MHPEISIFIPIKKISQRVPNKNYRDFNGIPLWEHTIRKFHDFSIYVDTDDPELVEELKLYQNVTAYLRPKNLIGHEISVCKLIQNWIENFEPTGFLFQIHVTNPFFNPKTLMNSLERIENHDSIMSCTSHQTRFWYKNMPINHDPDNLIQTQNLTPLYEENSLFYGFSKELGLEGKRIGKNPLFYLTEKFESLDIDTEEDWSNCIKLIKNLS